MSDYLYLPRCNNILSEGAVLYNKYVSATLMNYKIGYLSSTSFSIKVGCYKDDGESVWVFGSSSLVTNADIELVSPAGTTLFRVDDITTSTGTGGYYTQHKYNVFPLAGAVSVTVFDTLQEVFDAFDFEPPPGPGSGVVVTVTGSPTVEPPTTNGVIVTVIGRLSDPNQQGGTSTTGGGQGTFDDSSDPVPVPLLPTVSATDTGLIALFKPTIAELTGLSNYLWTNITDFIDNLNKLFVNPMDYIVALSIFPCDPDVGTSRAIKIGSVTTTINMSPILSQWYEFNCGTVRLQEYWGSALDYSPNTKVSLFLPFIGSVHLNTDEIMGKTIGLRYRIDLFNGQCAAMVTVDGDVYYQFTGSCSVSLPLTGSDWSRVYTAAIGAIGTLATGAIGASAAGSLVTNTAGLNASANNITAGAKAAGVYNTLSGKGSNAMRQRMLDAVDAAMANAQNAASANAEPSRGLAASRLSNTISNTVSQVMGGKVGIQHSGSMTGSAGMLGMRTAYLIVEYPNQSLADNYKHFVGYPSNMYNTLESLSGYTEVEKVLVSISGTDTELAELVDALKGGVYL